MILTLLNNNNYKQEDRIEGHFHEVKFLNFFVFALAAKI